MVGGFIRWDRLFEGSPTQDGKEVAERGAFAPVVEYDDQTHAFGLPGLITEPWQAMKRWLNGGAEENVARMRTGLPFTDEAAGDAFSIAGSAAMGSVAAPKPSGAYVTSGAGGNPKSKGVQHPGIRAAYQWRSKDAEPELQTSPKSHRVMEFDDDLARDAMRNYGEGAPPTSGYVLPDGTFLDFSEGSGMRSLDHRDVNSLLPEHLKIDPSSYGARAKEMDNFMAASRAMRWQPESPGFEVNMMPTREQLRAAANAAQDYWPDTPFMVDVSDPVSGSVVRSKTFERPTFGALEGFFRRLSDEGVDLYANPKESAALNAALQSEKQGTHLIDIVKKYGIVGAASLYGMTQGEIEQALADQGQGGFIVAPEPTVE